MGQSSVGGSGANRSAPLSSSSSFLTSASSRFISAFLVMSFSFLLLFLPIIVTDRRFNITWNASGIGYSPGADYYALSRGLRWRWLHPAARPRAFGGQAFRVPAFAVPVFSGFAGHLPGPRWLPTYLHWFQDDNRALVAPISRALVAPISRLVCHRCHRLASITKYGVD